MDAEVKAKKAQKIQTKVAVPMPPPHTCVIRRRGDFNKLFEGGFTRLQAISYTLSPATLFDLARDHSYERIEAVVGSEMTERFKEELAQQGIAGVETLLQLAESGRLRILVPKRTIHTKLYILRSGGHARIIITSANLSETARQAARQINYAWHCDVQEGEPFLETVLADYNKHLEECTLFMGDLMKLVEVQGDRQEAIRQWLASPTQEEDPATESLQTAIGDSLLGALDGRPDVALALPTTPTARKGMERVLGPMDVVAEGQAVVRIDSALRNLEKIHRLPHILIREGEVVMATGTDVERRSEPPMSPVEVNAALENLEAYCDTVELGQAGKPEAVKAAMLESILYVMTSPFFHHYMTAYRRKYGSVNQRGPRILYLYGQSHNGKSTLLRYALKLLAGRQVQPLTGKDFKKTSIDNGRRLGTLFPLAFDDVTRLTDPSIEQVLKSYWEVWWQPNRPCPQILLTSNNPRLKEWANTRVKRIDLHVHFPPDAQQRDHLAKIFDFENHLFKWFSYQYLDTWNGQVDQEDELGHGRQTLLGLYEYAGRPVPPYFPRQPFEKLHDPAKEQWRDLLQGIKKARLSRLRHRLRVDFEKDLQAYEVNSYTSVLPAFVNYDKAGHTVIVENPKEFLAWLGVRRRFGRWQF